MTITLEDIKTAHEKVSEMIANFEAQIPRIFLVQKAEIELLEGEHYAGIIVGKDGEACHHLILLAGDAEKINWADAKAWAETVGGELPTRREQSLLYANLKEQFQPVWHWSAEQLAANAGYAWGQNFNDGDQGINGKSAEGRPRAVRRLIIL